MTDRAVMILAGAGLGVQLVALGLGFTALGWKWPLLAAAALVSVGLAALALPGRGSLDTVGIVLLSVVAIVAATGAWHAFSEGVAAAVCFRVAYGLVGSLLLLILAFLKFFKLDRLW